MRREIDDLERNAKERISRPFQPPPLPSRLQRLRQETAAAQSEWRQSLRQVGTLETTLSRSQPVTLPEILARLTGQKSHKVDALAQAHEALAQAKDQTREACDRFERWNIELQQCEASYAFIKRQARAAHETSVQRASDDLAVIEVMRRILVVQPGMAAHGLLAIALAAECQGETERIHPEPVLVHHDAKSQAWMEVTHDSAGHPASRMAS